MIFAILLLILMAVIGFFVFKAVTKKPDRSLVKGKYGHLINPFQQVADQLPSPAPPGYNWELRVEMREDSYEYLVLGMYDTSIDEVTLQAVACLTFNEEAGMTYQEIHDYYGYEKALKNSKESIVEPLIEWANGQYKGSLNDQTAEYDYTMRA